MPGVKNKKSAKMVQPRQPSSLQGLLRFAMETTRSEDAPEGPHAEMPPMDDVRRRFLEAALKSMTIDVIELLQRQIKTLQNADKLLPDDDISEYTNAFTTVLEYIDNLDTANDFHKIGGFTIFHPCLKCVHDQIRASACDVLAELCQNNPYCQKVVLDNELIPLLMKVLDTDEAISVCIKAVYAISCICRQNQEGFNQFVQHGGLTILLKSLKKDDDKLRTKITFLLSALCASQADLKSRLVFLEYIPCLISLLTEQRKPSHEHVLSLLLCLVEENPTAQLECKSADYNLRELLKNYLDDVKNRDECLEEEQYCRKLIRLLQFH